MACNKTALTSIKRSFYDTLVSLEVMWLFKKPWPSGALTKKSSNFYFSLC